MQRIPKLTAAIILLAGLTFSASVPVPPNLKAERVPEITEELMAELHRYSEYRTAGFASWHPARREMLISTRFGNVPQLHVVKEPGGARHQITFFPEPVAGGEYQPETGHYIAFAKPKFFGLIAVNPGRAVT